MLTTKTSAKTNVKESLIQEIEHTSDDLLSQVLDFLLFIRERYSQGQLAIATDAVETYDQSIEDEEDIADARAALATIELEGTISWESLKVEMGL